MLRVIELFAGVGSQTQALKNIGIEHEIVGISEIDKYAIQSYEAIHGKVNNFGDITKISKLSSNIDLLTYSFPCFERGTLVQTMEGFKKIEDIEVGEYVLTHTNNYNKVLKTMNQIANEIYKLKVMCSEDIMVTKEHPFYVRERYREWNSYIKRSERKFKNPVWKPIKELTRNCYVGTPVNSIEENYIWEGASIKNQWGHPNVVKNEISEFLNKKDFWWLMGRYLGDGWQRSGGGIIICSADTKTKKIEDVRNVIEKLGINYSESKERTVTKFHISKQEYGEFCKQFGIGAINKFIPEKVLNLPVLLLKAFIEGYISADGCFTKGSFKASSISKKLIYTLAQAIHKAYKTHCCIYMTTRAKKCIIEGRIVNQNNTYSICFKKEKKKQDKGFYEDGYIWSPVNSIEKLPYNDSVYNLEVENDNSYVVQNIIVHNCTDVSISGKQEGFSKHSGTRSG